MKRNQMIPLLFGSALAAPTGTAISGSAVIGQTLTASATGTVTSWQWKRGGSNISGATNQTYVLVDADFGYAITVVATNASGSDTSAATALVAEAPAQSLGANVVTDGDFEAANTAAFSSSSGGVLSKETGTRTGGSGSKVMRTGTPAADIIAGALQTCLTASAYYSLLTWVRSDGGVGRHCIGSSGLNDLVGAAVTSSTWMSRAVLFRAAATSLQFGNQPSSTAADSYVEYDDLSAQAVTLNTQLAAPSANMRLTQLYTLPASPAAGDEYWIALRISDWSAGNYWLAILTYTGSQWNINLYSVATHTRTSRIAATNIGATNGIRINANGDSWTLETTANGGTNWTSRGTVTNATYNTATGVNALWTSGFTAGNLAYEAAV